MNYIILDLEWDSAYNVKHKRFINQILQIGAVKLDENFNITDTFEVIIKSGFSKKVSSRFATLTGITTERMLAGMEFDEAVDLYNTWAGQDTVTMTWSNSDLFTIILNEELLLTGNRRLHIEKYLDLQKFIQGEMRLMGIELKNQISLGAAAQMLDISVEGFELHTARDDCLICAALLKKYYNAERFNKLAVDTANPEFYKRLTFKSYTISDLADGDIDRSQMVFYCDKCGGKAKRINRWKYRNRWFSADFLCKECGEEFNGKVSFKKTYDDVIVRRRIGSVKPKQGQPAQTAEKQPATQQI